MASATVLGRVLELNRVLRSLVLRGCSLSQPEPPAPPVVEEPAEAGEEAGEEAAGEEGAEETPAETPAAEPEAEEGGGEEEEAPPPPPPPPPPPVLGAVIGSAMSQAHKSALELLDLRGNALGDEGVEALALGLPGLASLRALYLEGCCTKAAEPALAKGIAAQGAIVLCDLGTGPVESSTPAVTEELSEADGLPVVVSANRYEHALLWADLLGHFPSTAANAATAAFQALPGASATEAPLLQLLSRLVPPAELATINQSAAGAALPFGGYVQWLGDLFVGGWDVGSGPGSVFAQLMRAMAAPSNLTWEALSALIVGDGDESGLAWLAHAATQLCAQTRRYFVEPKPKPRAPADAAALCEAAVSAASDMLATLQAVRAPPPSEAEPEVVDAADAKPEPEAEPVEVEAEVAEVVPAAVVEEVDPTPMIDALLACGVLDGLVSSPEEMLHASLPTDLYLTAARDVLDKTYWIEMKAALRLEDQGAMPDSMRLDISQRPTQRNFYDDWDFFIDEVKPRALDEWAYCLSWLVRGVSDGSTSSSCLGRAEAGLDGSSVERTECLLERPFSAGKMRCVLSTVDGGATWLITGLQVQISSDFLPAGPLDTWHDTEPFRDAPAEEAAAGGEGEEAEEPA